MRSAEQRHADRAVRMAALREKQARRPARFPMLGVQIMSDGMVHTFNGFGGQGRVLGPAAGAVAEVGAERRAHRISGAIMTGLPVLALSRKAKASAFVTLADGTFHERKLDGNSSVSMAHREVAKFAAAVIRCQRQS